MSFTKNAENVPLKKMIAGNRCRALDSPSNPFRHPIKKTVQMQVGDQQHHRKQQDNGAEIDEVQRVRGPHCAKRHHQHGAYDGRARTVDLHSREFSERKDHVAAKKNRVGGEARDFAQGCGRKRQEPMIARGSATGNRAGNVARKAHSLLFFDYLWLPVRRGCYNTAQ